MALVAVLDPKPVALVAVLDPKPVALVAVLQVVQVEVWRAWEMEFLFWHMARVGA